MPTFEEPNEHIPLTSSNNGPANEYVPRRQKGSRRRQKSSLKTMPIPKSEMKKWDPASKLERKYKQNSRRRRKRGPSIWLRIINAIRKKLGLKPLKNKRKDRYYRNKYKQRYNKKKNNKRPQKNRQNRPQQSQQRRQGQKQNGNYKRKPYNKNKNRSQNYSPKKNGEQKPQNGNSKSKNYKPRRNRKPNQQGNRQQNRPQ